MTSFGDSNVRGKPFPLGLRLLMPSLRDMIFFSIFYTLTFGAWGMDLLKDADTGWHIRNGQHIINTLSVPHTDYFSYTMYGKPWFAWEWLYDVIVGGIHKWMGLNGVVILTALVISATFTLLFNMLLARGSQLLVALFLVVLSSAASTIHFLARPHVFTWLFTPIWFVILDDFQTGERRNLLWLPLVMLLWVNLHGGFIIGLVLLLLFMVGNLWTGLVLTASEEQAQAFARLRRLGMITLLCLLATLATPYGYKLHVHVVQYLSNSFLMDHISEFASPSFHVGAEKLFEALLLLTLVALAFFRDRLRAIDLLIILFCVHAALFAARNIPIASLLLPLLIAPWLSRAITDAAVRADLSARIRRVFSFLEGFSERMLVMESRFKAHTLPVVTVAFALWVALHGGAFLSQPVLSLHFGEKNFPVKATKFIAAQGIRDQLMTTDAWSGYVLYALYPNIRLFMDDRHDFFGETFVKEYLKLANLTFGWRSVLDRYKVNWVLVSPESPLSNALKEASDWKVIYDDSGAILFARVNALAPDSPSAQLRPAGMVP